MFLLFFVIYYGMVKSQLKQILDVFRNKILILKNFPGDWTNSFTVLSLM